MAVNIFSHSVELLLPSKDSHGNPLNKRIVRKLTDETHLLFCKLYGGASEFPGKGSFVTKNGRLIKEKILVIQSFGNELDEQTKRKIIDYAYYVGNALNQDSVLVKFDGKPHFISPNGKENGGNNGK